MAQKTALAIVGCGDVGYYVARLAWLNRRIRLVACVDPDPARAEYVAGKSGCRTTYRNLDELLEAHASSAA
ncbi:MAG: Gfo/Idh/MocA family oxidoreductase, partial [Spirochaetaceae bacterium]